jgi:tetratricopeptide (TPR) repeat protein
VVAGVIIRINMAGFSMTMMPPPGGSIFTALLTDLEIVARYLFNSLVPVWISAAYCIPPVTSLADPRVWTYGPALLFAFVATIYFSENRRLAFFAWIWIGGALGTHLNLKSIAFLMQDRYFYLSSPGLFLLLALSMRGLWVRSKQPLRQLLFAGVALVAIFAMMSAARSYTWKNMFTVFTDAVAKQPDSGYANYGAAQSYRTMLALSEKNSAPDLKLQQLYREFWLAHLRKAVDCPDARRIPAYLEILNQLGDIACTQGDFATGEKYFQRAILPDPDMQQSPSYQASAMHSIGMIRYKQGNLDEALDWLNRAEALFKLDGIFADRPRVLLALAQRLKSQNLDPAFAILRAKEDLSKVAPDSQNYAGAKKLMDEIKRFEAAP